MFRIQIYIFLNIKILHLTLRFSCFLVFWLYYAFLLTSELNSSGSLSVRLSLDVCVVSFWLYYAFLSISVLYSSSCITPFSRSLCCILLVVLRLSLDLYIPCRSSLFLCSFISCTLNIRLKET